MKDADDIFERTANRVQRIVVLLALIGSLAALFWRGWSYGLGFGLGAAASWVNFRWLRGFVAGLGPGGKPSASAVLFTLRYLILAVGGYVILKYSKLSLPALLAGLFVSLAAVTVEVLLQLAYARRNLDH